MNVARSKIGLAILVGVLLAPLMLTGQGHPAGAGKSSKGPDLNLSDAQRDAIIKADHRKNLDDAAALLKLAEKLKADFGNEDPMVTFVADTKMADDIQKLAKNISGRLKHN